jgi:hypothetical protein
MIIDTIVNQGDRVWVAEFNRSTTGNKCGFCAGEGLASGKNGHCIRCPLCKGTGRAGVDKSAHYKVVDLGRVRTIHYHTSRERTETSFTAHGGDSGIGMGLTVNPKGEEQLFCTTKESAQERCDQLNKHGAQYPKSGSIGRICDDWKPKP